MRDKELQERIIGQYLVRMEQEFGSASGFNEVCDVYAVLTYSDTFEVLKYGEAKAHLKCKEMINRLLEVRVFDNTKELRMYRDYIGSEFENIKLVSDENMIREGAVMDYYDDFQYLDVKKYDGEMVTATGGGTYRFPIEVSADSRVQIRNYVSYDEHGQAGIIAWRLVKFL